MTGQPNSGPQRELAHDLDHISPSGARTMLIVEDDAAFVEAIRQYVEALGYEVDVAADGVQGIRKIMAKDYTVILCDMVMPGLPGDMFYRGVERVKPRLCPRFIFMTGRQGDSKVEQFIQKTSGLVLWKPFKIGMLVDAVRVTEKRADSAL